MNTNKTSFALIRHITTKDAEAYAQLRHYNKNCGKFLMKPANFSISAAAIYVTDK